MTPAASLAVPPRTRTAARKGTPLPILVRKGGGKAVQHVYRFDEIQKALKAAGDFEGLKALLGGKGANLAEMTRLGLPVPPGFVVTTAACNAFLAAGGKFPAGMWEQVLAALAAT